MTILNTFCENLHFFSLSPPSLPYLAFVRTHVRHTMLRLGTRSYKFLRSAECGRMQIGRWATLWRVYERLRLPSKGRHIKRTMRSWFRRMLRLYVLEISFLYPSLRQTITAKDRLRTI